MLVQYYFMNFCSNLIRNSVWKTNGVADSSKQQSRAQTTSKMYGRFSETLNCQRAEVYKYINHGENNVFLMLQADDFDSFCSLFFFSDDIKYKLRAQQVAWKG